MQRLTHLLPLLLATASLAACHKSAPSAPQNVIADNAAGTNATESASGPVGGNDVVAADANVSAGNSTMPRPGNLPHRSTPHGNTDHGNTDH